MDYEESDPIARADGMRQRHMERSWHDPNSEMQKRINKMHQPEQPPAPKFMFTVIGFSDDRINLVSYYEAYKENAIQRYYKDHGMGDAVTVLRTGDIMFNDTVNGEAPIV